MRTTLVRSLLGTAIATVIAVSGATSAVAAAPQPKAAHPQGCVNDEATVVSDPVSTFVADSGKKVYGASGTTLSISAASGTTWSGSVSGSGKISESAIIFSADESFSASISYSKTTTVSLGGSWTVPKTESSGWLTLGSMGYSMKWNTGETTGNCTWDSFGSGTAVLPAQAPFIDHS
jgi:hypothetical protein